ncbi:MAG: twin-arginine translocase TatA/TatE family subunit [Mangrovibacterium sp.]
MVMLFIGGSEIVVILLVVLLLFGAKSIPEFARTLGKATREFNKATQDIKREINQSEPQKKPVDKEIQELIDEEEKKTNNTK